MRRIRQVAALLIVGFACLVCFETTWGDLIIWGILPAVVALGAIVLSVYSAIRILSAAQLVLGVPVLVVSGLSLVVLKRIFIDGAWPTYLLHLATGASCLLAGVQVWLGRRPARPGAT